MITAIPMKDDRVASHFTKADSFVFLDDSGEVVATKANPALNATCSGKADLLEMLKMERTEQIIVRNIGERMLGKLLENQFSVFQTNCGRQDAKTLMQSSHLAPLTDVTQGRQSFNYQVKQAQGGCGCHHESDENHEKCCSAKDHSCHESHQKSHCCKKHH